MKKHSVLSAILFVFLSMVVFVMAGTAQESVKIDPLALLIEPQVDASVERLDDGALVIRWSYKADAVEVYAGTQPDAIDRSTVLARVAGQQEVTVEGLDPRSRYYFELVFTGGDHDGQTLNAAERLLPLEGSVNFRDIGGYRTEDGQHVRWGLIYRTGEWANLTAVDLTYISRMNLKLICDLRSTQEVEEAPDRLPEGYKAVYEHLPVYEETGQSQNALFGALFSAPETVGAVFTEFYIQMVDTRAEVFGEMLSRFADPENLPTAFHCTAGKDRTGVATAILLSLLGVPEETIVADFTLSNLAFDELYAVMEKNEQMAAAGIKPEMLIPILVADPMWIEGTLAHIRDTYGSAEQYLRDKAGLDDATLQSIKDNLLQ